MAGSQSSGKSSVLEALTNGLPFPKNSGLCIQFPTQIVFKQSPIAKVEISIIPAQGRLSIFNFGKRNLLTLDDEQLLKMISEVGGTPSICSLRPKHKQARACIDLYHPREQSLDLTSFSFDMLRIELSSPKFEQFSFVDLPGLPLKTTPDQKTMENATLVRKMITKFMKNPCSAIMVVVPANIDIATQEIIHMAE